MYEKKEEERLLETVCERVYVCLREKEEGEEEIRKKEECIERERERKREREDDKANV